jgi:hypothetical protein
MERSLVDGYSVSKEPTISVVITQTITIQIFIRRENFKFHFFEGQKILRQ